MINLHESMGPGRDRTRDPWICSQTRTCSQTRYRLRYAARLNGGKGYLKLLTTLSEKSLSVVFEIPRDDYKVQSLYNAIFGLRRNGPCYIKVRKVAKIRNRYNQVPHLTQDTTWESDKNTTKREPRGQPFLSR